MVSYEIFDKSESIVCVRKGDILIRHKLGSYYYTENLKIKTTMLINGKLQ